MDATTVRKEIKAWERSFKAQNSRDATVDDIKTHPEIAEKYKLYKKLSKAQTTVKPTNTTVEPPRTPPRRFAKPSESPAVIPKSRPIHSTVASSSNPFSPVKTPRRKPISPNDAPLGIPNLYISPFRPSKTYNTLPVDVGIHATSNADPPRSGRAFSKARKRLRGDSVSPSPKKQRFSTLKLDEELDGGEGDQSFVDESPVKPATNGKNFVTLFEEERISAPNFSGKARSSSTVASARSGTKKRVILPSQAESSQGKLSKAVKPSKRSFNGSSEIPSGEPDFHEPITMTASAGLKRRGPDGHDSASSPPGSAYATPMSLLPPSPTQEQLKYQKMTVKDLMKKRKKMNTLDGLDFEDQEDESIDVVELELMPKHKATSRHSSDDDEDRFFMKAFARRADDQVFDDSQREPEHELDVHLPEELRDVLHISSSQTAEMKERAIAESLLKGESTHSGQIAVWGVGEVTRPELMGSDDEEDWEGEGLAWEVGEL